MAAAPEETERPYYNISQAAEALGVSRVSIWRWINAGVLPVSRLGHRTARISRADLNRVVAERMVAGGRPRPSATRPAPSDWSRPFDSAHFVQFYERDSALTTGVCQFVAQALTTHGAAVVVATEPHRERIAAELTSAGIDLSRLTRTGHYQALDAAATLEAFMVDGQPERERFFAVIGQVLDRAALVGRTVRAFGEMVALLAEAGNHVGAVTLELLWEEMQIGRQFTLYCAYPIDLFGSVELASAMDRVATSHGRVIPAESYTQRASDDERTRAVLTLQQKAQVLEAEIAQRKLIEDRLRVSLTAEQSARESAEAALRQRDEFVSIASHELKTPLTTLSGYAQLMLRRFNREGELDLPRVVQAFQSINAQADKLGRLLNHLLDVSRLEAGKLILERQPTDMTALVEQVVDSARGWSEQHTIALNAPLALEANVDGLRLEQVLVNLLDNAVKYSPDGGPIDVELLRRGGLLELSVRDHGLGIPRPQREHIFERFYQAHSSRHRVGLGLGLFISRQIVDMHGGQIRVEFPRGRGTRFIVRLPMSPARRRARRGNLQLVAV